MSFDVTDPPVAAARRAWAERYEDTSEWTDPAEDIQGLRELAVAAAREMAEIIKKLHKRVSHWGMDCDVCDHCYDLDGISVKWPCDTAKLVYPKEEL